MWTVLRVTGEVSRAGPSWRGAARLAGKRQTWGGKRPWKVQLGRQQTCGHAFRQGRSHGGLLRETAVLCGPHRSLFSHMGGLGPPEASLQVSSGPSGLEPPVDWKLVYDVHV